MALSPIPQKTKIYNLVTHIAWANLTNCSRNGQVNLKPKEGNQLLLPQIPVAKPADLRAKERELQRANH